MYKLVLLGGWQNYPSKHIDDGIPFDGTYIGYSNPISGVDVGPVFTATGRNLWQGNQAIGLQFMAPYYGSRLFFRSCWNGNPQGWQEIQLK